MISYRIDVADAHAHLFRVTLSIPRPAAAQRLSLPVWIPGSYLVREFARHLSGLTARQGERELPLRQLDKATWLAHCGGRGALTLNYFVYAFDASVRAAFLDAQRGFFNGTCVFLRVHGREAEAHRLRVGALPAGWRIATALPQVGPERCFVAADYDALVDHPVELGRYWCGRFSAAGVAHEFVVAGAPPGFDGKQLLADAKRICETVVAFWHGAEAAAKDLPFERYLFMLNTMEDGHGGLEHRASTALLAARRDLPCLGASERSDGYVNLLGLISHEYFHTWNIKRLRPAEFERIDYAQENYTELLWFFEGFTSYYDDLLLLRAGVIGAVRYLALVAKAVSNVAAAPGRKVQSLAQASFDAWVKHYRSDENTPNATISYYAKGALLALALDLSLRAGGGRGASLDRVMRRLWQRSGGGPIDEDDILGAVSAVGGARRGAALADELRAWVHGTDDLPLAELLGRFGVHWQTRPATLAQRWGLRVTESALTGAKVGAVLRGSAAERAGLAAGDELIAVDGWRVRRLDDAAALLSPGKPAQLLVARDQRVLSLEVAAREGDHDANLGSVELTIAPDAGGAARALRKAWLAA